MKKVTVLIILALFFCNIPFVKTQDLASDIYFVSSNPIQIQRGSSVPFYVQIQNTGDYAIKSIWIQTGYISNYGWVAAYYFNTPQGVQIETDWDVWNYGLLTQNYFLPGSTRTYGGKMTISSPINSALGKISFYLHISWVDVNDKSWSKTFGPAWVEVVAQGTQDLNLVSIGFLSGGVITQQTYDDLNSKYSLLNSTYSTLQNQYNVLKSQSLSLQSDKTSLQSQLSTLQNDKATLQSQVSTLQSDKSSLQSQVSINSSLPIILGITTITFLISTIYLYLKKGTSNRKNA